MRVLKIFYFFKGLNFVDLTNRSKVDNRAGSSHFWAHICFLQELYKNEVPEMNVSVVYWRLQSILTQFAGCRSACQFGLSIMVNINIIRTHFRVYLRLWYHTKTYFWKPTTYQKLTFLPKLPTSDHLYIGRRRDKNRFKILHQVRYLHTLTKRFQMTYNGY